MRIYVIIAILLIISVGLFFKKESPKNSSSMEKSEKTNYNEISFAKNTSKQKNFEQEKTTP